MILSSSGNFAYDGKMPQYFLRIGSVSDVVYLAQFDRPLPIGTRTIVRTLRGIEFGEVVGNSSKTRPPDQAFQILRPTTREDELLIQRLERRKREAIEQCRLEMKQAGCDAVLVDVEQVFDGGTVILHLLGELDKTGESITHRIIEQYESIVDTRAFAKLLEEGCGPGCGDQTTTGTGRSCVGCEAKCPSKTPRATRRSLENDS